MIFNPVFGGGAAPVLGTKTITTNGTYNASSDNLDGYSQVTANVPNTYAAGDEGKVVSNGALVAQSSENITQNGTYDTTLKNQVVVNVSGGSPNVQAKTGLSITANGSFSYTPDAGYDGLSEVSGTVNVSGGGGGTTTYTPTAGYRVSSINGSVIVKNGNFCSLDCRLDFSSGFGTEQTILTLPNDVIPNGLYWFVASNGGTSATRMGYIAPNGNVVLTAGTSMTYIYFHAEWFLGDAEAVTYDTALLSGIVGGLSVKDGCAELACQIYTNSYSAGWKSAVITIPVGARPSARTWPCVRYGNNGNYFADTFLDPDGTLNIFMDRSRGTNCYVYGRWEIAT